MRNFEDLYGHLEEAARRRLIDQDQVGPLHAFLEEAQDLEASGEASIYGSPTQGPSIQDETTASAWAETPRLVRGFHDILITIGILAVSLGGAILVDPAFLFLLAWVLAEYFVRWKRLALPGFTLTLIFSIGMASLAVSVNYAFQNPFNDFTLVGVGSLTVAVAMFLFFLRFRTPIALALILLSGIGTVYAFTSSIFFKGNIFENSLASDIFMFGAASWVFSIFTLLVALRFDLRDLQRRTISSDVAFWMHFVAAPAFLYSTTLVVTLLYLLVVNGSFDAIDAQNFTITAPIFSDTFTKFAAFVVVLVAIIGVILDRRAFVSAGLISLGAAAAYYFNLAGASSQQVFGLALLFVGAFVLLIGSVWDGLRAQILRVTPAAISRYVRPAHTAQAGTPQ